MQSPPQLTPSEEGVKSTTFVGLGAEVIVLRSGAAEVKARVAIRTVRREAVMSMLGCPASKVRDRLSTVFPMTDLEYNDPG